MKIQEVFARGLFALIVIGMPVGILGYNFVWQPATNPPNTFNIEAYAPESGGFTTNVIRVPKGELVTLNFTSMDVTHGIAIGGGLNLDLGHVDPGEHKTVELTFEESGTYTFYCTTWCSKDHWRMRGVIEVYDPENPDFIPSVQPDPIIEQLIAEGVNIDAVHSGNGQRHETTAFTDEISAQRGAQLINTVNIPAKLQDKDWRFTHTPAEAVEILHTENPTVSHAELADVVTYLWADELNFTQETKRLYDQNCAACHGQTGNADGPAAPFTAVYPVAFADTAYMFGMRSDVLYAKIRRGGMGTDMPNFGTLFSRDQTQEFVDYLWSLGLQTKVDE